MPIRIGWPRSSRICSPMRSNFPPEAEKYRPRGKAGPRVPGFGARSRSGIPEEFKSRIFGKFAQADGTDSRRKGGTGLGLNIVKQIVERLGGKVGFHDAPGGGTVFYVELPAWDGSAGGEIDVDVEASPPRLLLCDDDPAVAKVIRMRLRPAGFAVDFAHTPDTAMMRAGATRYAAILVDLRLRESDGIDLILRSAPNRTMVRRRSS